MCVDILKLNDLQNASTWKEIGQGQTKAKKSRRKFVSQQKIDFSRTEGSFTLSLMCRRDRENRP